MRLRQVKYQVPTWQNRTRTALPQDGTYGPFGDDVARVRVGLIITPARVCSGATRRLLTSCSWRPRKARMTTPASTTSPPPPVLRATMRSEAVQWEFS